MFWDDDGRRMKFVKAEAFDSGKVLNQARIPGDTVFPWVNAATEMFSQLELVEENRARAV
ncbi:hypothetical protein SAMN04489807_1695 [Microbacterium hydrocarbonoxydans]|uniref:Uncharacterized protein n=2 Tax=Microbacterium hydrocarbonoxydans TaxID=273678 RepID=A0A1H4L7P5_9MICO|nr:hypothetical protein SAMN04489807_1695 [Microbacterium hydrocarbonoxydans]